jgi:hypothetical protein
MADGGGMHELLLEHRQIPCSLGMVRSTKDRSTWAQLVCAIVSDKLRPAATTRMTGVLRDKLLLLLRMLLCMLLVVMVVVVLRGAWWW